MSSNLHVLLGNNNFKSRIKAALLDLAFDIVQEERPFIFNSVWKARNNLALAVLQNNVDMQFYTELLLSESENLVKAESIMQDPGVGLTDAEIRDWFSTKWTLLGQADAIADTE